MQDRVLEEKIWALCEPAVQRMGFDIIEVEWLKGSRILRIFMDRTGAQRPFHAPPERDEKGELTARGVTLDDCSQVSRALDELLDTQEIIPGRYHLEVSSPGLDRPVRRDRDWRLAVGCRMQIKLAAPVEGRKKITGRLVSAEAGEAVVEENGRRIAIPIASAARAHVVWEFDQDNEETTE
ncbi:MAG: Ribosome maturation factor RimP [Myxococcota bacterium]|nr:Ribosome maturation factor RimP [Myxococcota bacterium]